MTALRMPTLRNVLALLFVLIVNISAAYICSEVFARRKCNPTRGITAPFRLLSSTKNEDGGNDDNSNETPLPESPPIQEQMNSVEIMKAMGTSPRRILIGFASSIGIALAANFLGVTSKLLEAIPEPAVEATGLDTYYPRGDFRRYKGPDYTFVIPKRWVGDTGLELAKVQRRAKTLDYGMKQSSGSGVLPNAAFGPPGRLDSRGVSKGDTNVSVIVSKVGPGFSLRSTLGSPERAAETLLQVSLAPEGSGRVATLIKAEDDLIRDMYQFEYVVDRGERGPPLRAISVIAERNGEELITLTVVAPRADWDMPSQMTELRKIASSFHLT